MRGVQVVLSLSVTTWNALGEQAANPEWCSAHHACAGLSGDCCPNQFGITLECCNVHPEPPIPDGTPPAPGGCAGTQWGCCSGSDVAAAGPNDQGCSTPAPAGGAVDPGGCAVDITAAIAAITSAAKNINYAVEDCPNQAGTNSKLERACADDITSAITDFGGAAKAITSATYTCGGVDTSCANDIINSITSLSAASETLVCAATDCEENNAGYDAFSCIVDIFDTVDTLVHFSKSIYDAIDHCGPPEPTQVCDKKTAGQTQVVVVDCKGAGCDANGDDQDCAWCVTDPAACHVAFGEAVCSEVAAAREAQGVDCSQAGNDILPNERRLMFNV